MIICKVLTSNDISDIVNTHCALLLLLSSQYLANMSNCLLRYYSRDLTYLLHISCGDRRGDECVNEVI